MIAGPGSHYQQPQPVNPARPGYTTTEFWVTLLTGFLPITTLAFHQDFSGDVEVVATGVSGLATLVYILSRTFVKRGALAASAQSPGTPGVLD